MKRNQSGFTLIEIAIVLVIIGLLLGGVLKGQELINSAKVKNLATDFKNIPIYIYGYQDKYKALPGDDANAVAHLGTTAKQGPIPPAGNGIINGPWTWTSPAVAVQTDESYLFWQHIRLAGFGPGSTDTTQPSSYLPTNAVGGPIGVTNSLTVANGGNNPIPPNPTATPPIPGLVGTYIVCSGSIPFKFAKQLDVTLDDGNTATGSLQVTLTPDGTPGTPVPTSGTLAPSDDTPVTVCMGF